MSSFEHTYGMARSKATFQRIPRRRDVVDPEIEERLSIMTIDGEMPEADARAMMKAAPP